MRGLRCSWRRESRVENTVNEKAKCICICYSGIVSTRQNQLQDKPMTKKIHSFSTDQPPFLTSGEDIDDASGKRVPIVWEKIYWFMNISRCRATYIENGRIVLRAAQYVEATEFPLARRRDEDGIHANIAMCRCTRVIHEGQSYLIVSCSRFRQRLQMHGDGLRLDANPR